MVVTSDVKWHCELPWHDSNVSSSGMHAIPATALAVFI